MDSASVRRARPPPAPAELAIMDGTRRSASLDVGGPPDAPTPSRPAGGGGIVPSAPIVFGAPTGPRRLASCDASTAIDGSGLDPVTRRFGPPPLAGTSRGVGTIGDLALAVAMGFAAAVAL